MEAPKNKKRAEVVGRMILDTNFTQTLSDNPGRFSTALGFCETGQEITNLIAIVFKYLKNEPQKIALIMEILNGVLEKMEEREMLR